MTTPLAWLKSVTAAATSRPWWLSEVEGHRNDVMGPYADGGAGEETWVATINEIPPGPDAEAITTLHNLAPSLLAVVEAAQAMAGHFWWDGCSESGEIITCCSCDDMPPCAVRNALDAALAALDLRVEEERNG